MKSRVAFAEEKLHKEYNQLREGRSEERELYSWISRALDDIAADAHCGIPVPKRLIPREYVRRYDVKNLWKYDLPRGWRLIYAIRADGIVVISLILEWFDHKGYERRFRY